MKAAHSMSRAVVRELRSHVPASPHAVPMSHVAKASLTVAATSRGGSAGTVVLLTQLVACLDGLGGPRALPEPTAAAVTGPVVGDGHTKSSVELAREAMGPGCRRPPPRTSPPPTRRGPVPPRRDRDDDLGR